MKQSLVDNIYTDLRMKIRNVCHFNWNNCIDVDKSIYSDFDEYFEVKIREVIHRLAIKKGLMK